MRYHYLYKLTNLVNGKFYYGKRSSSKSPVEDEYYGSGIAVTSAVKKYGKHNFRKDILEVCDTFEQLSKAERQLITEEVCNDKNCYNIAIGGNGGMTGETLKRLQELWSSESYRKLKSEIANRPDVKAKNSQSNKITWSDPKLRSKMRKIQKVVWSDEELKSRMIKHVNETLADPELKAEFSRIQKEVQNRPEERARNSRNQKVAQNRPEVADRKRLMMHKNFSDSSFRSKHKNACNSESFKSAQRKKSLGKKWMHKGTQRKLVDPTQVEFYHSEGWILGLGPTHISRRRKMISIESKSECCLLGARNLYWESEAKDWLLVLGTGSAYVGFCPFCGYKLMAPKVVVKDEFGKVIGKQG